ncbi:hypothetical protein DOY81_012027 [Sarcophaga bullata]|nr:hypothetical protein DOY81_012027 [Sarcophaga bullata]
MVESSVTTIWSRLKQYQWGTFFHMFYIEPVVFLLVFSHSLSGTIMKNEIIYQACTTIFNYNDSDCIQLGTKNVTGHIQEIETEIQPYVANLFMIRTLLESIVPAICGVFIGSWSDHYGRKPLLLVSMIGFSCTYIIAAIISEMSNYYMVNPWYYILAVIPHSILGAFLSIGLMIGSLLSSFVYSATGATFTFAISGILMCLSTAYIALYVPESLKLKTTNEKVVEVNCNDVPMQCTVVSNTTKVISNDDDSIKKTNPEDQFHEVNLNKDMDTNVEKVIKTEEEPVTNKTASLFSYVHVKDMWITCFKKRPYYDRSIILFVTGTMFLAIFVLDGAMTVFYLFVREKFQWTIREFTFYETISHVVSVFGALVGFLIMRKVFSMSVVTLAIVAIVSDMIRNIIQGIATDHGIYIFVLRFKLNNKEHYGKILK